MIVYPTQSLGLCSSVVMAKYATTTEVTLPRAPIPAPTPALTLDLDTGDAAGHERCQTVC